MADIRYEIKRGNKWIQCIKSSPKAARIADSVPTEKGKTMLRRCSNCKYCFMSWNALRLGILVYRCGSFDTQRWFINFPFWSGWRCKAWRAEDGK